MGKDIGKYLVMHLLILHIVIKHARSAAVLYGRLRYQLMRQIIVKVTRFQMRCLQTFGRGQPMRLMVLYWKSLPFARRRRKRQEKVLNIFEPLDLGQNKG